MNRKWKQMIVKPTTKSSNIIKLLVSALIGAVAGYAAEGHKFSSNTLKELKFMTLNTRTPSSLSTFLAAKPIVPSCS